MIRRGIKRKGLKKRSGTLHSAPGRTKPKKTRKGTSKPKKTKIALFREWGVPDWAYRRYSGLKGVYWYWFSKEIRKRDYDLFEGRCMTCDQYVEPEDSQCGHLFAARNCGFALLFHPKNNHLQHSKCNNPRFTPSAGIYNAINIEKRYGSGTIAELAAIQLIKGKEWSKAEYIQKILELNSYQSTNQ